MNSEEYWKQDQTPPKCISCICGYTVPAYNHKLLRSHQELCRKFKKLPNCNGCKYEFDLPNATLGNCEIRAQACRECIEKAGERNE